ncbi:MAG: tetraacyldisaccharide 4'-kinase [Candidatus Binataceae bacterium]
MGGRPAIAKLWQPRLSASQWPLWAALTPLSALYAAALAIRSRWWRGMAQSAPVATISVGNLTVGGNGKTPFTLFLAGRLRQRGYRVGIVSRGYGRRPSHRAAALVADGGNSFIDAAAAGDEPAMMAHTFDGPIAVARRRLDAIRMLATRAPLDVILLDDAFQHQRLRRDLDLVLIAAPRGVGNGWTLPAGPLREPLSALRRADAVILVSREVPTDHSLPPGLRGALTTSTVLQARVRPRALVRSLDGAWTESTLALKGKRVAAVSGLAEPGGFAAMLRELGAKLVGTLEYRDHHRYSPADWRAILSAADGAELVLTTEKDLVKLEGFSPALASLYAVRLEIVMEAAEESQLLAMVTSCIERKRRASAGAPSVAAPAEAGR